MTSSAAKPVIVIVPGAWHVPAHYAHLAIKLNAAGYTVDCVELSSTNEEQDLPEDSWTEDLAIIRNAITSHMQAGRDVAVVMHSFGGVGGSEAAFGLGKKNGDDGRVVKLIYMTAFMVEEGWKRSDFGSNETWPNIAQLDEQNPKFILPREPRQFLYNDVPEQMCERAIDNLHTMTLQHAHKTIPSKVAWREISPAYILCEDDAAITAAGQQQMIDAVRAQGIDVEVTRVKAGHSPFLSKPGETAKAIRGFLGDSA